MNEFKQETMFALFKLVDDDVSSSSMFSLDRLSFSPS